jgi:hypothetical protein
MKKTAFCIFGLSLAASLTVSTGCSNTDDREEDGTVPVVGDGDGDGDGTGDGDGDGDGDGISDLPQNTGNGGCQAGDAGCNEIDLLFVIDNSGTMGEEQLNLAKNFPLLIQQLETLEDEEGSILGADVHIMVTTSDFGNPLCDPYRNHDPEKGAPIASSCLDRLDRFTGLDLEDPPVYEEACTDVCDSPEMVPSADYIHFNPDFNNVPNVPDKDVNGDGIDDGPVAQALACIGPQGIDGCGYEAPLENMLQALNPGKEWNASEEPFLRDSATLAVAIITDEADCSVKDWSIMSDSDFQNTKPDSGLVPSSAICWNAGVSCDGPDGDGIYTNCTAKNDGKLQETTRYINYLVGELRQNQDKNVVMLGVVGIPEVERDGEGEIVAGGVDDLVYRDWQESDILPEDQADGIDAAYQQWAFGIGPGCTGYDADSDTYLGQAIPPVRIKEVCESLNYEDNGEERIRCCMESICDDDFSAAITCLTDVIQTGGLRTPRMMRFPRGRYAQARTQIHLKTCTLVPAASCGDARQIPAEEMMRKTSVTLLCATALGVGVALSACADDPASNGSDTGGIIGDGDGDGTGDGDGDGDGDGTGDGDGDGDCPEEGCLDVGTGGTGGGGGCGGDGSCNMIDVLFVLDNSGTMGEEQANLAANFPLLITKLREITDSEGNDIDPNVNIMVTTTDLGHPSCTAFQPDNYAPAQGSPITEACVNRPDDFTGLGNNPPVFLQEACLDACPVAVEPTDDFIHFEGPDASFTNVPANDIEGAMSCIGPQGINGCGYEAPLEAMMQAINPTAEWNTGDSPFLRDGAILAIAIVTDEADCSVRSPEGYAYFTDDDTFWENNPDTGTKTQATSAVCWNSGVECGTPGPDGVYEDCNSADYGVLHPLTRYLDYLQTELIGNDDKRVIMLGVVGIPEVTAHNPDPPFEPTAGGVDDLVYRQWDGDTWANGGDILPDDEADGATANSKEWEFGIGPGCTGEDGLGGFTGQAIPPVRVKEVCQALNGEDAVRCCLESICDTDFSPAINCLAGIIQHEIPPAG